MADVNISKYRASVVRSGSTPATPGFVVSEGQNPVEPAGSEQNHLPVTINATANALAITTDQVLSGAGTVGQYIRGDGSLADFPSSTGGGSSVSYYLNGSVSQGTIGGVAYKELSKVPILGTGTDFTINANGYIASFLTDAGDPNLLEIPGGNWNFETYFSASSGGGSPTFYVELYKYDGSTFTLIASNSGNPELIAFGTNVTSYFSTLAVPTTALTLTDRLAIRYYVTHSGRTITLHTENNHLCQVITTFTTGLTALNGLTAQVQYFAVGSSGTDFNIASATQTHTFNLPTASATNRGALSSADWSTFNAKQNALTLTTSGSSGASTLVGTTLNVPTYTLSGLGGVPTSRQLTINGTAFDLSADRSWSVGTVTSVGLSSATSGVTIGNTPVTGSGTITLAIATATSTQQGLLSSTDWSTFNNKQNAITLTTTGTSGAATLVGSTLNIPQYQAAGTYVTSVTASSPLASSGGTTPNITIQQASGSQSGFLSSTDWTTFNNKQNALTNPVTGTGTTNYLPKFTGSTTVGNSQVFDNGNGVSINYTSFPAATYRFQVRQGTNRIFGIAEQDSELSIEAYNDAVNAGVPLRIYSTKTQLLNGNLLVGTTSDNGARLQVSGMATFSSTVTSNGAGFIIQGDQQYRMNGYNSGYSYITTNAGFNSSYNGVGIFSNATNANSLPAWVLDLGGLDGPSWGGVTDGLTISRKASGGSWANFFRIASTGAATFSSSGIANATTKFAVNGAGLISSFGSTGSGTDNYIRFVGNTNNFDVGINGTYWGVADAGIAYRLLITQPGNVLIGTTTDNGARLQVSGRINATGGGSNGVLVSSNSGSVTIPTTGLSLNTGFNVGYLQNFNGGNYVDLYYGASRHIFDGGNVGIGTSSPSNILHLFKSTYPILTIQSTSYQSSLGIDTASGLLVLNNESNAALGFNTNATERMRITSGGNVGIGTSSPGNYILAAEYNASNLAVMSIKNSSVTGYSGAHILNNSGTLMGHFGYGNASLTAPLSDLVYFGSIASKAVVFTTADTEKMRITSGGNVLIGTTTDNSHKLRVNGTGYFDTGIKTGNPVGSTTNDWLLGRALVTGTSTPDRWIRVQIGNLYYDILAVYMGSV